MSRSTSGNMILMIGGVVAYYSGRQTTVALCTAIAETIALAKLVVKVKHMRALLFDLQCCQDQETQINSTCVWVDNTAAIAVATGNDLRTRQLSMLLSRFASFRNVYNGKLFFSCTSRQARIFRIL